MCHLQCVTFHGPVSCHLQIIHHKSHANPLQVLNVQLFEIVFPARAWYLSQHRHDNEIHCWTILCSCRWASDHGNHPFKYKDKPKTYSKGILFFGKESSLSLSHVVAPLSLVPLISFLVHDLSIAMLFSLLEVTFVHSAISLCLLSLSCDFTIFELSLVPWAVSH